MNRKNIMCSEFNKLHVHRCDYGVIGQLDQFLETLSSSKVQKTWVTA